jgi:hypothetical protein
VVLKKCFISIYSSYTGGFVVTFNVNFKDKTVPPEQAGGMKDCHAPV